MKFSPRSLLLRVVVAALLGAGTASALHYSKVYPPGVERSPTTRRISRRTLPQRQVIAPEGVLFLSERMALTRSSGIIAIVPGTAVRVLSRTGNTVHVTDGNVNFDVSEDKLTNDVNRAAILSGRDLATEEALARQMVNPNDEFRTTAGKVYKNATVNRVEPDGIIVVTDSGISKVYFTELPPDVRERFHYDPDAAVAYSATQAANQQALQKQQEELKRKLAEQNRQYWASRTAPAKSQSGPATVPAGAGAGEPVKVIAHGSRVDINKHLVFGRVTVVDFYADWCGPCRQVSPHLEQMANTDPEVAVRKIDIIDWKSPVALQYNLHHVPQINIYNRRGALVGTVVGVDLEQIQRYVAQAKASG
jgi:thioredoxin 1